MRSPSLISAVALLVAWALVVLLAAPSEAAYKNPVGESSSSSSPVCYSHWQSVGPFAVRPSSPPGSTSLDVIGAVQEVWVHDNVAFLASPNGGVWRTTTFHTPASFGGPHWEAVAEDMPCASISAISGSPQTPRIVVAGCGSRSAVRGGGEPLGVMITMGDGDSWRMTSFPEGYDVSSVLVSGTDTASQVLVAARGAFESTSADGAPSPYNATGPGGIWYSADAGLTFTLVYANASVTQLKQVGLTSTVYATTLDHDELVLVSHDFGASWAPVPTQPDAMQRCTGQAVRNAQITVSSGAVVAAFFHSTDFSGHPAVCYSWFHSNNQGANWTQINLSTHFGSTRGLMNFAVLLAPHQPDILFAVGEKGNDVIRVNVSVINEYGDIAPLAQPISAEGTRNNTAPHADVRQMFWDNTTGELLVTSGGGLYKRTAPLDAPDQGDWVSLAGDLAISEVHQAAVDPATGAMIIGAQDIGMVLSQWDGSEAATGKWSSLYSSGNGTSVGVDTSVTPARFIGSNQGLDSLLRVNQTGNPDNPLGNQHALFNWYSPCPGCFGFHTKLAVNLVEPSKTLVCTQQYPSGHPFSVCMALAFPDQVLESIFDSTNTSFGVPPTDFVWDYVYGGRRNDTDNAEVVLAVGATFVWSRDSATAPPTLYNNSVCNDTCSTSNMVNTAAPWNTSVIAVVQHPRDYYVNLVIDDAGHSWLTHDFGQSWIDLNLPAHSNLLALNHSSIDTFHTGAAIFVDTMVGGAHPLIIGTPYGSFVSFDAPNSTFFSFRHLGANQPHSVPSSYSYQTATDTLTMSMLGRGVWQLQSASVVLAQAARNERTADLNSLCTRPLYPNLPGVDGYNPGFTPAPIGFPSSADSSTGSGDAAASTGDSWNQTSSSTGVNWNETSSTGVQWNETSSTGGGWNETSSTGSHGNDTSSTGQWNDVSTGTNWNETSSTGSAWNETSSTGPHWDSASSTGATVICRNETINTTTIVPTETIVNRTLIVNGTTILVNSTLIIVNGTEVVVNRTEIVNGTEIWVNRTEIVNGTEVWVNRTEIVNGTEIVIRTTEIVNGTEMWVNHTEIVNGTEIIIPSIEIVNITVINTTVILVCDEVVPPSSTGSGSTSDSSTADFSSSTGAGEPSSTGTTGPITPAQSSSASAGPSGSSSGGNGGWTGPDSGGSNSTSSSSTGIAPPSIVVPESLPVFELILARTLAQLESSFGSLVQFGQAAVRDLAAVCQVPVERVLLLHVGAHSNVTSAVLLRFTLSDRLVDSQLRSQIAGRFFLDAVQSPSFNWGPSLVSVVAGSGALASDQSVVNQLPLISFKLAYNLGGLPGGNLARFSARLVADIAALCGISTQRIAVQRVLAGSVQATFVVAPPVDPVTEPAMALVTERFIEGLNNQTSSFYTNSDVAAAAIVGSGQVGSPGAPPPAPTPVDSDSDSSGFMDSPGEIGLVVGVVIGGLLIGAGIIWVLFQTVLKPKPTPKVQDRKPAVQLSSIAVQDPPRTTSLAVARAPLPAATRLPPLNKPLGAGDVRLTLANGYGPVRPLLSPSAGGGPGAKPVVPEDTAHFTLSEDVGAQPYFAGAPAVVAGSPSSPAPYGARPASPGLAQSPASPQAGVGSGAAHPAALSRARSPNSFRIMYSSKKKALPSMLPSASPSSASASASAAVSPAAGGAGALSPLASPSSSYSPASSSAATHANNDAAMRLKMRQAANNVSGNYSNNGRSAY